MGSLPELVTRRQNYVRCLVVVGLVCVACGLVASWWLAGELVSACPCSIGPPPPELNAKAFTIASQSGATIAGWYTSPRKHRGVVLLLHGIRGSRLSMLQRARLLHAEGFATVMIDLQAHGESTGDRITVGHLEKHDVRAAVHFARQQYPTERLGVLGVSLGGAAALLASPLAVDALVLESVYSDIEVAVRNRVAARLGPFSTVAAELLLLQLGPRLSASRAELRPIDRLSQLGCPVLIASGTDDIHTTEKETRAMFDAAGEPKELWLVNGAEHQDLLRFSPTAYRDCVVPFLKGYLQSASAEEGGGSP